MGWLMEAGKIAEYFSMAQSSPSPFPASDQISAADLKIFFEMQGEKMSTSCGTYKQVKQNSDVYR